MSVIDSNIRDTAYSCRVDIRQMPSAAQSGKILTKPGKLLRKRTSSSERHSRMEIAVGHRKEL